VKFHNGEPWNAQAAKFSIDITGDPANGLNSYTYTGPVSAEVMDDLTVDVVCEGPCPIFPRTSIFQRFQAPAWYQAATEAERASSTIGFGPYKYVEWRPGESIELQAYEDYLPNPASRESQAPIIKDLTQVYRSEALVRATMVKTGEADFAFEIGLENIPAVPQHQVGGTAEVLILQFDTIWHPELKKQKVRQAITHAIDCPAIVRTLYEDTTVCRGNASSPGTLGITDKNASPYKYDPELARRLLQEAEYDPANRIDIIVRIGRLYRGEELGEATVGYLREVGINAELKLVERSVWQEISRTGCGQYKEKALDCMNQPPGPPTHGSSQAYFNAPGNEILDYVRLARSHMDCFRTNAHYCDPQRVQPLLEQAAAASGDERRKLLEELADIHYNEVVVLPFFDLTIVYGLSEDLVFTPRYDRVVRANMLYFAR
jgi:peptide/nickel transport system substrate-binding protein